MARVPITLSYETGAADIVKSHSYLLKELRMSNFTQYLGESVQRIGDRKFNAYMTTNAEKYKHMFEWGTKGGTPASRLWKTVYSSKTGLLTFTYRQSVKQVPGTDEHTKYFHVFREKAAAMEEAPTVTIAPDQSKFLRWKEKGVEFRSTKPIKMEVAGGVYKGKFNAAFLAFWVDGAGGTMTGVAHAIRSSPKFQLQYKRNKIIGLKRRITNQQGKAAGGDAKARLMAAERIKEYEREIRKLGGTL